MPQEFSEYLADEVSSMSALVEAQAMLRRVAEPVPAGDCTKAAMLRAWRSVNAYCQRTGIPSWSFNRVRDVWRPDPRIRVRADEINTLRQLLRQRRQEKQDQAVRHELSELRQVKQRLAILEDRLAALDQEFHQPSIAALREAGRQRD